MENGYLAGSLINEREIEEWEAGQDLSQNQLEPSSSDSAPSVEPSVEESAQAEFSPEYELGAMQDYNLYGLGVLYGSGVCAGFAVAICIALASWVVTIAISMIKRGGK